jgi:hypothetical protein
VLHSDTAAAAEAVMAVTVNRIEILMLKFQILTLKMMIIHPTVAKVFHLV